MTIVEAIVMVLKKHPAGMTSLEIYNSIIEQNLYTFGAKKPSAVVNGEIRRRCNGLNFPTAYPLKVFEIVGYRGKKPLFSLLNSDFVEDKNTKKKQIAQIDLLPEEIIDSSYKEHLIDIRQQILDNVLNNSPAFFEHMVMDLLLKMGYGYDEDSGVVTGRSHDGGVDGIINEDKLGLDLIYIQAKRYNEKNTIGRKEIQAFIGAMEHVQKGVFITTSSFTREAIDFVEKQQQKSIKLINGVLLSDLLVKYQVGINIVKNLSIYKIDSDYYIE